MMLDDMGMFWIWLTAGHWFWRNQSEARWPL